jgi:hypothetical protein
MSQFNSILSTFNDIKKEYESNPTKKNGVAYRKALLNLRAELGNERKSVLDTSKSKKESKENKETKETHPEPTPEVKPKPRANRKPKTQSETADVVVEKPKRQNNKKKAVATLETKTE